MATGALRAGGVLMVVASLLAGAAVAASGPQSPLTQKAVDRLVQRALSAFAVPGAAVAIVRDGKLVHVQGYGLRNISTKAPVNTNTVFKIASNSKAFTTAALAILVDEGRLHWGDRVTNILPRFRFRDPYVSRAFTIADLLTHRSGLAHGAGDLMLWPEPNHFTRADIIRSFRYFTPAYGFRSRYAYDNTLYIVAGEVIAAVSGQPYEDFVDQRIMKPLGLRHCFAGAPDKRAMGNLAAPHGVIDGTLQIIDRSRIRERPEIAAAAGGLKCSIADMALWVQTQLARGVAPNGVRLFSAAQSAQMWRPHTIMPVSDADYVRDRTHFKAYGLGWRLADVRGYKQVSHTGTLSGFLSQVTLIPELDLGVVVLLNGTSYAARKAIMRTIVGAYTGAPPVDWVARFEQQAKAQDEGRAAPARPQAVPPLLPLSAYAGEYVDPWFGRVQVQLGKGGGLYFSAIKSPLLAGAMTPVGGHRFALYWDDRSVDEDACVMFESDVSGHVSGMTMARINPDGDFSSDYQDLRFTRIGTGAR